jgi:hypothetical protein
MQQSTDTLNKEHNAKNKRNSHNNWTIIPGQPEGDGLQDGLGLPRDNDPDNDCQDEQRLRQ